MLSIPRPVDNVFTKGQGYAGRRASDSITCRGSEARAARLHHQQPKINVRPVNLDKFIFFRDPFAAKEGKVISAAPAQGTDEDDLDEYDPIPDTPILRLPSMVADRASYRPRQVAPSLLTPVVMVVGVGYVGKHLVERFGDKHIVVGFDLNSSRCQDLRTEFDDNPNISIISDMDADKRTSTFDLALISVPTLLLPDQKTVDTRHIKAAVAAVAQRAKPGSVVVIESSVTVGMTRALLGSSGADLRAKGVFVGFSPERVDPGRTEPAFKDIPKIVSGIDDESRDAIALLYRNAFNTVVPVASLETAEFTKLYENCQRLMLISYVNEMSDACAQHGVDIHDVCAASATKPFGFTPFTPSLGAGGHCIPVNPWYLLSNCDIPVLRAAATSNQLRPVKQAKVVTELAQKALLRRGSAIVRSRPHVLIYGMGFKRGESSLAYAPTVTFARKLEELGCSITYTDDYVRSDQWARLDREQLSKRDKTGALAIESNFDAIVGAQRPERHEQALFSSLKQTPYIPYIR